MVGSGWAELSLELPRAKVIWGTDQNGVLVFWR